VDPSEPEAFAGEGQHRIRAGLDLAVDGAGEVDPEEWELGIWHRVDQPAHQIVPLGPDQVVLAAERDDPHAGAGAGEPRDDVGVEPGAVDEPARSDRPGRRRDVEAVAVPVDRRDPSAGADDRAPGQELAGESLGHLAIVDDRRGRRVDRADRGGVGLDLAESVPVDEGETLDAVGGAALEERLEPRQLRVGRGDDHLADRIDADPLLGAERLHQARAFDAELCLVEPGL
jgi:hypothetical protein